MLMSMPRACMHTMLHIRIIRIGGKGRVFNDGHMMLRVSVSVSVFMCSGTTSARTE